MQKAYQTFGISQQHTQSHQTSNGAMNSAPANSAALQNLQQATLQQGQAQPQAASGKLLSTKRVQRVIEVDLGLNEMPAKRHLKQLYLERYKELLNIKPQVEQSLNAQRHQHLSQMSLKEIDAFANLSATLKQFNAIRAANRQATGTQDSQSHTTFLQQPSRISAFKHDFKQYHDSSAIVLRTEYTWEADENSRRLAQDNLLRQQTEPSSTQSHCNIFPVDVLREIDNMAHRCDFVRSKNTLEIPKQSNISRLGARSRTQHVAQRVTTSFKETDLPLHYKKSKTGGLYDFQNNTKRSLPPASSLTRRERLIVDVRRPPRDVESFNYTKYHQDKYLKNIFVQNRHTAPKQLPPSQMLHKGTSSQSVNIPLSLKAVKTQQQFDSNSFEDSELNQQPQLSFTHGAATISQENMYKDVDISAILTMPDEASMNESRFRRVARYQKSKLNISAL